jgi:FKBP-type peptidyl-prolyl cis-trans isomerase FkpA
MKSLLLPVFALLYCISSNAIGKDSTINYNLPDSVKAMQFMAEIKVIELNPSKRFSAGISTKAGDLYLSEYHGKRSIQLQMHEHSRVVATGQGIKNLNFGAFYFDYNWEIGKSYKLMVAMAADSADKICLYSAYVFLPDENKWKFIGSRRHPFYRDKLEEPSVFLKAHKKSTGNMIIGDVWCQRSNGTWRNMKEGSPTSPTVNYFGHMDSVTQRQIDIKIITDTIAAGKTDAVKNLDGIYYSIMKEGTGRQVTVNDTVVAYYKGYLLSNGLIFDQTKEKPATFPLKRLIKGWQIGVPICKVGGKIKLVIPSDLAYSIRTRSAKIPPNSILVFEIEVVDTKPPI